MRQQTYLNVILTLNAALLAAMLWTQLAPTTRTDTTEASTRATAQGIPNAAEQRLRMIEALRDIKTSVDATLRLVESGAIKVEVTNLNDDGK